jgi:hypothetical protein
MKLVYGLVLIFAAVILTEARPQDAEDGPAETSPPEEEKPISRQNKVTALYIFKTFINRKLKLKNKKLAQVQIVTLLNILVY